MSEAEIAANAAADPATLPPAFWDKGRRRFLPDPRSGSPVRLDADMVA